MFRSFNFDEVDLFNGEKPKVAILGGGVIGSALMQILTTHMRVAGYNVYDVSVYDLKEQPEHLHIPHEAEWVQVDDIYSELDVITSSHDYVVNLIPDYSFDSIEHILNSCIENKAHYLDCSEDYLNGTRIRNYVNQRNSEIQKSPHEIDILVAPHCGLAPGLISMMANFYASQFQKVDDIHMYVGALPKSVSGPLMYSCTWSPDGVINEYRKPIYHLKNGKKVVDFLLPPTVDPDSYIAWGDLEKNDPDLIVNRVSDQIMKPEIPGRNTIVISGREYESFYTSGGAATMVDTWKGRANNVTYSSIRHTGHITSFWPNAIIEPDAAKTILDNSRLLSNDDEIIFMIEIVGKFQDQQGVFRFSKILEAPKQSNMSSIQYTTAAGVITIIDAHRSYRVKNTGFLKQEELQLAGYKNPLWNSMGLT